MIRRATVADLPRIMDLGADFLAYSPHRDIELDRDAFAAFSTGLIEKGVIFLSDEGMIGGFLSPAYFNPAYVMAVELFWWAASEGTSLRLAFEGWAKDSGARRIVFTGLVDDRERGIRRVFSRAGYAPVEMSFVKDI